MEDWAEIRRLHRSEGMPIRAIVRKMGIGRNTVRRAPASNAPPKYERKRKGSIVDAVEPQIRELLATWPDMPTRVIAERIGWERSMTVLKDRVRELRPLFAPPDPASRTQYRRISTRLPRDYYVRLDSNDYSVHPSAIGRRVEVAADLNQVTATCGGRTVATHERCWASHQTITDPDHDTAAGDFRRRHLATTTPPTATQVQQHKLTDYDRMFGLTDDTTDDTADPTTGGEVAV